MTRLLCLFLTGEMGSMIVFSEGYFSGFNRSFRCVFQLFSLLLNFSHKSFKRTFKITVVKSSHVVIGMVEPGQIIVLIMRKKKKTDELTNNQ